MPGIFEKGFPQQLIMLSYVSGRGFYWGAYISWRLHCGGEGVITSIILFLWLKHLGLLMEDKHFTANWPSPTPIAHSHSFNYIFAHTQH